MFDDAKFLATVPVSSLEKAKEFYEGKLGLNRVAENPRGLTYVTGGGNLFIYESPATAGSSKASVATWELGTIEGLPGVAVTGLNQGSRSPAPPYPATSGFADFPLFTGRRAGAKPFANFWQIPELAAAQQYRFR